MRKNFSNKPFLFFAAIFGSFLLFTSCRTSKQVSAVKLETPVPKAEPADTLLEKVLSNEYRFDWFSAKADVEYTDANGEKTSFNVTLRAHKDSIIWLSITPLLGIEVARALITRDSVQLLDRLKHDSYSRDYRFLEEMFKTSISFEMLQAMLTGNYFLSLPGEKIQSVTEELPYYILSTRPETVKDSLSVINETVPLQQDFWINSSYRISKSRLYDITLSRTFTVTYNNFIPTQDVPFAQQMHVLVEASKPSSITVDYIKFSKEGPLSFPFTVPDKYERK